MQQRQAKDINEKTILLDATNQWFCHSPMNQDTFAILLGEAMQKTRQEDFMEDAASYSRWLASQKKKVSRVFKEEGYFPLEWKIVWLSLLPEPYQGNALAELLALMGMMPIPLPIVINEENVIKTRANLNVVTHLFSQLMLRLNPALDGYYDSGDCRHELQELSDSYMSIVAQCKKEIAGIEVIGIKPRMLQIFENSPLFKG